MWALWPWKGRGQPGPASGSGERGVSLGSAAAQLDFVVFVDAREDLGEAFVASEEAFRASARRTKWDIAQE